MEPIVTVITVVFRAEALIGKTMTSVAEQTMKNTEHLVIDGGSDDRTLDIIRTFQRDSLKWISERDGGIYDAMNKGLSMAKGKYVIFLNAGDEFYDRDVLHNALGDNPDADFYYGNTAVINLNGEILGDRRLAPPENLDWKSLRFGMCVSHQSMIVKRAICAKYDLKYKISADIDWTINTLKRCKQIVNTKGYIAKFLEGGVSSSRRKSGLKERFVIMSSHYGLLPTLCNHVWILLRFIIHAISGKGMT
jgi:glycosyltransferase involved in cell wall biosynthesis